MERTVVQLYRDCFRLAHRIGGRSAKGDALRSMLRTEFRKNAGETDAARIDELKQNAVRGLSNYLIYANAQKDPRLAGKSSGI